MMIRIPESNFDQFCLPRLVMGCSPFELHTHPYVNPKRKTAIYSASFKDLDKVMKIISAAADVGIDTINLGRHSNLIDLAGRIKRGRTDIRIIPLIYQIPLKIGNDPIPSSRTESTVFEKYLGWFRSRPIYSQFVETPLFKSLEDGITLSKREIDEICVDTERLEEELQWFEKMNSIRMVMTCIDLFVTTGRCDLIRTVRRTFKRCGYAMCAGTHFAHGLATIQEEQTEFESFYTPLNKMGFFMIPSRDQMLKKLLRIKKPYISIKPLAGGRIKPLEAFRYIFSQRSDAICMIGLSSILEVREAVLAYGKVLGLT